MYAGTSAGAGAYVYKNTAYVFWLCRQRGANINFFFHVAHSATHRTHRILTEDSFILVCIQANFSLVPTIDLSKRVRKEINVRQSCTSFILDIATKLFGYLSVTKMK